MPALFLRVCVCCWIQIKRGNIQEKVLWPFLLLLLIRICSYPKSHCKMSLRTWSVRLGPWVLQCFSALRRHDQSVCLR